MLGLMSSLLDAAGIASDGVYSVMNIGIKNLACAVIFFIWAMIGFRLLPDHDITAGAQAAKVDVKKDEGGSSLPPSRRRSYTLCSSYCL